MIGTSIIIPVLNESGVVEQALTRLQSLRAQHCEIIVVDGGSCDATRDLCRSGADQVLQCSGGRGAQMRMGAASASGEVLVFLHADTSLPKDMAKICSDWRALPPQGWGWFRLSLQGSGWLLRVVERGIRWRSRLQRICTGDQVIYINADLYAQVGGFAELPLMEDIDLCRRLKRVKPPQIRRETVHASARRWLQRGPLRTIALMWWLRLAYSLGVSAPRIARWYGSEKAPR